MDTKERLFDMLAGKGHPVEREAFEVVWSVARLDLQNQTLFQKPLRGSILSKMLDQITPPPRWHSSTRRSHA